MNSLNVKKDTRILRKLEKKMMKKAMNLKYRVHMMKKLKLKIIKLKAKKKKIYRNYCLSIIG